MNDNDNKDEKLIRDDKSSNENDDNENHQKKKIKLINEEVEEEIICAICFENNNLLPQHGCKQCNQESFKICKGCHNSCLSRLCPLCRGEYAPIIYTPYPMPISIPFIPTNYTDPRERFKYSFATAYALDLTGKINVAAWWPDDHLMHFVLPIEKGSIDEDTSSDSILVSITLTDDLFFNGDFLFSNKIWDLLEQKAIDEEGEDEAESVDTLGDGPDREAEADEPLYCTCNKVEYGYMINCSKEDCPIKWFHFRCVGLTRATTPTIPWICSSCCSTLQTTESINGQEPIIRIVNNEEQKQPDVSSAVEESQVQPNIATRVSENLINLHATISEEINLLNAIEFSQASAQDSRKWLISKLLKSGSILYTEIFHIPLNEIISNAIINNNFE